ncbi:ABC transporter permease [Streptacidiphilus sp. P02-A3a]|nr:ABC transporter permease [Streptacidiphilus sp. P02-A3a]
MLLPVLIVLAIGTVFVSVYLAAFHAPRPHRLPVAVVGSAQTADRVGAALASAQPGGFEVRDYPDPAAARAAVEHRTVYAAYLPPGTVGGSAELLYGGANGTGVTATVTGAFGGVAKAGGATLDARDVVPGSTGDTRGLSVFYAAFGVVLAGFMFGSTTYQLAPRLEYRWRMLSLLVFGALGGVMVALVAGQAFHALPGPFLGTAGVVALMATASGGATMALARLLGAAGVSVSSVLLLILGNASSGGILPAAYLPGWLHPLHAVLPVGVGVRAIQGLAYFRQDGLVSGIAVLVAWIAICAAALYLRDVRPARTGRA